MSADRHGTFAGRRSPPFGTARGAAAILCGGALLGASAAALLGGSAAGAQSPAGAGPGLPFRDGEILEYRVASSRFGEIGSAWMRVEGPVTLRGREVLRLSMETRGRVLLMRYEDEARSWLDPERMTSLRYEKVERHPLASREESVEILSGEGRWVGREGEGGPLGAEEPLDELSFIYFVRTLELDPGWTHTLERHFDPERNPVRIRVGQEERLTVPAGTFVAVPVEMTVRDPRRYGTGSEQTLRIHFSADARRIPLRIESTAPAVGRVVMTLASATPATGGGAGAPASRSR